MWIISGASGFSEAATEEIENLHVAIFYSSRGGETIPPKFHFSST